MTFQPTCTLAANNFSVGGSTFVVAAGNVGIGVANPTSLLQLANGGAALKVGGSLTAADTGGTDALITGNVSAANATAILWNNNNNPKAPAARLVQQQSRLRDGQLRLDRAAPQRRPADAAAVRRPDSTWGPSGRTW